MGGKARSGWVWLGQVGLDKFFLGCVVFRLSKVRFDKARLAYFLAVCPSRSAVPDLVPAGIFLPAKAFLNAHGVLFGTKLIG